MHWFTLLSVVLAWALVSSSCRRTSSSCRPFMIRMAIACTTQHAMYICRHDCKSVFSEALLKRTSAFVLCLFSRNRSATARLIVCRSVNSPSSNCLIKKGTHRQICTGTLAFISLRRLAFHMRGISRGGSPHGKNAALKTRLTKPWRQSLKFWAGCSIPRMQVDTVDAL
jgi:hypothetical protein